MPYCRHAPRFAGVVLMATLCAANANAATTFCDFEGEKPLKDWTGYGMNIAGNAQLATEGKNALGFTVPAWTRGKPEWPAFEFKSTLPLDWSAYDRLVIDIRSNSKAEIPLWVYISDRMLPFRQSLQFDFSPVSIFDVKRYVIDLAKLPPAVDRTNMGLLHFFSERPNVDVDFAIDRLVLLEPGEEAGDPDPALARETRPAPPLLFDFENPDDLATWSLRNPGGDTLDLVAQNATSGQRALHFRTNAYRRGMGEWPAFEYNTPVLMDWSAYDRLVFDVANTAPSPVLFAVYISDDKIPFRKALFVGAPDNNNMMPLLAQGKLRVEVDLNRFPKTVDRSRIAVIHFFVERPGAETDLYLDNFRLLAPGEGLAPTSKADRDEARDNALARFPKPDAVAAAPAPAASRVAADDYAENHNRLAAYDDPDMLPFHMAVTQLPFLLDRVRFVREWEDADTDTGPFLLAWASAAEKVFPRRRAFGSEPVAAAPAVLSLARREQESIQLVVLPRTGALAGVGVKIGELRDEAGNVFPAANVDVDVVGFVEIPEADLSTKDEFAGWWPDPLMDWVETVDIAAGDSQAFWLRFRCPAEQPAGVYRGEVTVADADGRARALPVQLEVRPFTLPAHAPMPLAMCTFWHQIRKKVGAERWKEVKDDYVAMFARYWMAFDQIYMTADFDVLEKQNAEGLLGCYNLDYLHHHEFKKGYDAALEYFVERIGKERDEAIRRGIWEHAYVYGFDEFNLANAALPGRLVDDLKERFPDLYLLTTAYDHNYGQPGTPLASFDAFCPLTPDYDLKRADEARARGKKVWWYVCVGPRPPYANFFVNCPSIDGRLLMGAMSAKYRPDGFLYYALALWDDRHHKIDRWPYTNWNPRSFQTTSGDGQWLLWGPDDQPVATMRLENFRDGLEDYAYHKILEATVRQVRAGDDAPAHAAWLDGAEKALLPPEELVAALDLFSRDPAVLSAWRESLAAAIVAAPVPLADPWGPSFGPRGFDE